MNTEYGNNFEVRNRTKDKFKYDIEDDLDDLIFTDPAKYPELADKLLGVLLEEYTPKPCSRC